jgi:phage replication O-like protein O
LYGGGYSQGGRNHTESFLMSHDELQVENGNFTRIVNPLIEHLIQIPFKGCELAVALYIIRKTYGFQKKQDEISISQFVKDLKRSRQTIVTALKNLQLVNIARLVSKGDSKKCSNRWEINKYYETWELVKIARLVKRKRGTSLTEGPQLVYTARHTKENTKEIQKKGSDVPSQDIQEFIYSFKEVNPSYERLFANKTERGASVRLLEKYGKDKMLATTLQLPKIISKPYAPRITTPYELEKNLGKLLAFVEQNKNIVNSKIPTVLI